jgi:hypothetical protein
MARWRLEAARQGRRFVSDQQAQARPPACAAGLE